MQANQYSNIFRNRGLILLCVATFISFGARTMQRLLFAWWTLEITNSPSLLGIVTALNMLPMVFGIASGIIIDRFDRKKVLIAAEALGVASSIPLTLAVLFGAFQFWQVLAASFVSGIEFAFSFAARGALLPDIVKKNEVVSAMAFMMLFWNGGTIIGPYAGGVMLEGIGYAGCFAFLGAAFILEMIILLFVPGSKPVATAEHSIAKDLVEGSKYVAGNQGILAILMMAALWNLLITPYQQTLTPIFVRDVLGLDAAALGTLEGGIGVGALLGSVFLMSFKNFKRSGLMAIVNSGLVGVFFVLLSMSRNFALAMVLLVLIGFVNALINTMSQTPLLVHTPDDKRGLVMGMRGQAIATMPVGSLIVGAAAGAVGSPLTIVVCGISYTSVMMVVALLAPRFRKME